MTSRKIDLRKLSQAATAVGALSLTAAIIGCAEEPPPPPPPPPAPKPEPPPPDPMENVRLDDKVTFPDHIILPSPEVAMAAAALANAIAEGDDDALRSAIVPSDHSILDALIAGGLWGENTESIEAVRLCAVEDNIDSVSIGIGVQDDRGAYLLAWETGSHNNFLWQSLDVDLQTASRVSELDDASLFPRVVAEAKQFLVVVEEEDEDDNNGARGGTGTSPSPGTAPSRRPGPPAKPKRRLR